MVIFLFLLVIYCEKNHRSVYGDFYLSPIQFLKVPVIMGENSCLHRLKRRDIVC